MAEARPGPAERLRDPRLEPAAALLLAVLAGVWTWWALKEGAYFGVVLLPGAILLCATAALLAGTAPWRLDLRRSPAILVAGGGLAGLGLWTVLAALWSPAPDVAVADGQRILTYALAFGLGAWLGGLLGGRLGLALLPLLVAAGAAGVATIVALLVSDVPRDLLELDGTLDFPLGYRNANAAFFALSVFPAVALAADPDRDWRLRGAALGVATLCLDLAVLCQSRASVPAMLAGIVVFVLVAPVRARAAGWLALAALPALAFAPVGLEIYQAAETGLAASAEKFEPAALAALATSLAAAAAGALCARLDPRPPLLGATTARLNRAVAGAMAALAVLALGGFVAAVGDPVDWLDERLDEFLQADSPDLEAQASRFSLNAGSARAEIWEVALDDAAEDPLLGTGGGGFAYSFLRERDEPGRDPRDAHSVELETLGEYGLIGLALLAAGIGGALAGAARSRRRAADPGAPLLAAAALAVGAYWLVHSSVDWFWSYPVVTAPVLALLGSACAPAATAPRERGGRRGRIALAAAAALLALSAVPPFLSERYVNDAYDGWRSDLERAYSDLDRAAALNPLADGPLLAEGAIAREVGDRERATAAFTEAVEKRPEEWVGYFLLAELGRREDPVAARARIRAALERNPYNSRVFELARRLGVDPELSRR